MVAPTYTFIGFNYSIQNLPHHRTEIAYRALPSKAKAFVGTHAGKLPCSSLAIIQR